MSIYQLSWHETWVLSTLLHLPIQQGSVLGEWLGNQDAPSTEEIETWIPQAVETLSSKGYYHSKKSLSAELTESLMLAAVGQKSIYTTLRTNIEAFSTHFLLAGSGVVQYGVIDEQFILHSPLQWEETLASLLPDWLSIEPGQSAKINISQSAFLLFKQACLQRDIAYILNEDGSETFQQSELETAFARDNGWIDVFSALGITGAESLDKITIQAQLDSLLSIGYLESANRSRLQIGAAGAALADSLSDPEQVSITIGFTRFQPEQMTTSVFLIGKNHLFRLDFLGEIIEISQMQSRLEALDWMRTLVSAY
ncbi:MAG: hypothetical protein ACD_34C00161G0003 [uncultured bacterium]|nr:MAG: hypothetical protein ACD_34C00161G0003 [uncultured bacterium]